VKQLARDPPFRVRSIAGGHLAHDTQTSSVGGNDQNRRFAIDAGIGEGRGDAPRLRQPKRRLMGEIYDGMGYVSGGIKASASRLLTTAGIVLIRALRRFTSL
jgi:hypothetical protein